MEKPIERLREGIHRLKERRSQAHWDTNQLLKVVNRPLRPERTRHVLMDFTSSKNYMEIARSLDQEDAAKLVDVFDQVCHSGFRNNFTRLTTVIMTRQ